MKVKLVCGLLLACAELYCPDRGLEFISPELMVVRLQHEVEQLREQLAQALEQVSLCYQGWVANHEAVVQLSSDNGLLTRQTEQYLATIKNCSRQIEDLEKAEEELTIENYGLREEIDGLQRQIENLQTT